MSDCIKVFVRIRPQADYLNHNTGVCLNVVNDKSVVLTSQNKKQFTYDHIFDQTCSQEKLFEKVGKRIVEGCIEGYNGTIFAYGQTGSGKTYTMLGPDESFSLRGVIPRCLQNLFELIQQKTVMHGDLMTFECKCSFLEIYRENIYDLLDKDAVNSLQLRESNKRGIYVDGITKKTVVSAEEAFKLVLNGINNRHVASTSMNRESSRSHAVFSITVESKDRTGNLTTMKKSVLNLVDLAGSERQSDTASEGERFIEAGSINKSLSVIGNVIMSLVQSQPHIPYRESKLTFLLRDSLGGNARTHIVANVHPSQQCANETLSTLQFASRSKMIKNKAKVNASAEGDLITLKNEVKRLTTLLAMYESTTSDNKAENCDNTKHEKQQFFHAMRLWEMDSLRLNHKIEALQNSVAKINNGFLSSRMVVKFRDETIKMLKNQDSGYSESKEIELLKNEIKELNNQLKLHPEVSNLKLVNQDLKQEIQILQSASSTKCFFDDISNRRNQLIEFYNKMKNSPLFLDEISQKLKEENEDLKIKNEVLGEQCKLYETQLSELRMELNGALKAKDDALKVLEDFKKGSKMKIDELNSQHDNTIKILSTPQKSNKKNKKRISLTNPDTECTPIKSAKLMPIKENLFFTTNSSNFADNFLNESIDIPLDMEDDYAVSVLQYELDNMKESKIKQDSQIEKLENENLDLRQDFSTMKGKLLSVQESLTSEQTANLSIQENLAKIANDRKVELEKCLQENTMKTEEIRDLKIILKSSDKELDEKKQQLKASVEIHQKELENLKLVFKYKQNTMEKEASENQMKLEKIVQENNNAQVKEIGNLKELVTNYKTRLLEKNQQLDNCNIEFTKKFAAEKESAVLIQNALKKLISELEVKCNQQKNENSDQLIKIESLENVICTYTKQLSESQEEIKNIKLYHQKDIENFKFKNLEKENNLKVEIEKHIEDNSNQFLEITNLKENVENLENDNSKLKTENLDNLAKEENLKLKIDEYQNIIETLNQVNSEKTLQIVEFEKEILNLKTEISEKERQLLEQNSDHMKRMDAEKQCKTEIEKTLKNSISEYKETCAQYAKDLEVQRKMNKDLENKIISTKNQSLEKEKKLQNILDNYNQQVKDSKSTEKYQFEIENLQDDLSSLTEHYSKLSDNMSKISQEKLDIQKRLNEANILFEEKENLLHKENEKCLLLTQQIDDLKAQNEKLLNDGAKLAGHRNHLQKIQYLQNLKTQITQLNEEKAAMQLKYDRLQAKFKQHEKKTST